MEGVLPDPPKIQDILIGRIDIDEAVSLCHAIPRAEKIGEGPEVVSDNVAAVLDGEPNLVYLIPEEVDSLLVVDSAIRFELVMGSVAVFGDHHGKPIVVIDIAEHVAQGDRVDLPVPIGRLDIGVGGELVEPGEFWVDEFALHPFLVELEFYFSFLGLAVFGDIAAVAVQGYEIDFSLRYELHVSWTDVGVYPVLIPVALYKATVLAVHIEIEPEFLGELLGVHRRDLIFWPAALGVDWHIAGYRADFAVLDEFVTGNDRLGVGEVHDVVDSILGFIPVLDAFGDAKPLAIADLHVLLIEREPVFDLVSIFPEYDAAIVVEVVDDSPIGPAAVAFLEAKGKIIVIECDDGSDVVREQLVDEPMVKGYALGVARAGAVGDNAGPGYRKTVGTESALGHERHILLIVVVMVCRDGVVRIRLFFLAVEVDDRGRSTPLSRRSFNLPGRARSSPHKAGGEGRGPFFIVHSILLSTVFASFPCRSAKKKARPNSPTWNLDGFMLWEIGLA